MLISLTYKKLEFEELKSKRLLDIQAIADTLYKEDISLLIDDSIIIINPAVFFFHPDYASTSLSTGLGSTSTLITDMFGDPYQFFLNLPFGEIEERDSPTLKNNKKSCRQSMAEQRRSGSFNNPYKFNGKELDAETSLYYYGARYYNPRISNWLSVDPIALWQPVQEIEHYIEGQHNGGYFNPKNMSVYGYTYQSPVIYVDPNGKQTISGFLIGKDVGLYVEYNMDFNTVKVGKSNVSIKYNIGTSNISITQGGSDERYATREFQKGIDIPSFAVNMVDFASDVKMDILLGSALTIDEGIQSLGISSETSSIITTEIINYLSNMINDVKDGKATLTYSKADNIYIKKNGKHYKYTDGYNWTVKYRNGDGTKLFLRYTDYNDKRSVEKRKKDTENYKQRLDAIRNDSVIQSKKRENGGL